MTLNNDTRGWILTCISAIACIIGSLVICVDVIVRQFPGKRNFKIEENNSFLSSSLSLSFGVMLFSSLNSMLPSAKDSLQQSGFPPRPASFILLACFLGGAAGIQIVSSLFHRFLPSHVVDCDHSHDDEAMKSEDDHEHYDEGHHGVPHQHHHAHDVMHASAPDMSSANGSNFARRKIVRNSKSFSPEITGNAISSRRPSLHMRLSRGFSKVFSAGKDHCDDDGPCHGFSEPCGQDCFNNVLRKGPLRSNTGNPSHSGLIRSTTQPAITHSSSTDTDDERYSPIQSHDNALGLIPSAPATEHPMSHSITLPVSPSTVTSGKTQSNTRHRSSTVAEHTPLLRRSSHHSHHSETTASPRPPFSTRRSSHQALAASQHHHHVPTNPYLTLSLQTTLAIALHKLPEGFITYAANHASPKLGFTVFFSLFVHNISEGFAMALPLYLALHSRWKAICWSSVLGGASQPLGAGIAALYFGVAARLGGNGGEDGSESGSDGKGVQGGLIAVTAGIMTSVALQLFAQALDKSHNRNLCMIFAFVGMAILSISSAVTA
ncbi:MAG: hypothetical protein M1822_007804 [Bathelium mastoideum]|nr:MAG: hypothetical protein M1822_007804 [Bathelium mastoideum]